MRFRVKSAALAVGLLVAAQARAVTFRAETTAGLMQQPTSHYYHLIYGGLFEISAEKDVAIGRVSYVERPAFKKSGFVDQDRGIFAMIGRKLGKAATHGVYPFFGVGQVSGYVRSDPAAAGITERETRTFALPGLVAALEYQARFGPVAIGGGHQTFVGYVDADELRAFVAWPYNFYQVHAGVEF